MTDVTRRDLLGVAAIGALAATLQGCRREDGDPALLGRQKGPINIRFAVEGLSVVHREVSNSSGNTVTKFIRLAAINPLKNPDLGLKKHRAILGVPRAILKSWEPEPLLSTMDYVYWSILGWKGAMEVTVAGKKYKVGADTQLSEYTQSVDPTDCVAVRGRWANANLLVKFSDIGVNSPLATDWHTTDAVSGYLELPFGVLEHRDLPNPRHERFDEKLWHLGTQANPGSGQARALKNAARLYLARVEAATINTGQGVIEFKTDTEGYDWKTMPVVFSNLDITSHDMGLESISDFTAYYEILMNPPAIADRRYPSKKVACGTTVECGCCPPLAT